MTLFPTQPNIPSPTTAARPVAVPAPGVSAPLGADDAKRARILADAIRARFAQTLVGQDNLRESLIVTLVAGGHILIESVPGLAKTTAAQTLATCVSGSFKRVQCTPDLMPSDLVGTQVFDFASQKFTTQIGPIHANFVLLDEINRSNAKTQSAMLEAMAEGATTIGGQRIALPKPFMVIATENPIEEEGTFNLPEAQMDRFMMKAVMTYPSPDEEARMLAMLTRRGSDMIGPDTITGERISVSDVDFLRKAARRVHVSDAIMRYAVDITATSRGAGSRPIKGLSSLVRLGASPRATIALTRIGQAKALLSGRDYVVPEDLKAFAHEYPSPDEEARMLAMLTRRGSDMIGPDTITGERISVSDVDFLRKAARRVHVSDAIMRYAVDITATSRGAGSRPIKGLSSLVRLGASPRATIALTRIGQAKALLSGRDYVVPEDLKAFAHEVLRHRIMLTFEALADGVVSDQIVDKIVETVPVP